MSEPETNVERRFVWPAEYYSGPSPRAVLPRGVTFGCGAAAVVALLIVFGGGIFLARGGMADFMDLALGMSMGDLRGMYTAEVTPAQKAALDESIESLRKGLREGKVSVARLDPVFQNMRQAIADKKMTPREVETLTIAARGVHQPARR
jgi:hypothetical protein